MSKHEQRESEPDVRAQRKETLPQKQNSDSAQAAWQRGADEFNRGNLAAATAAFEQAVELQPGNVAAHNDLGACYLAQQDYLAAQAALEAALAAAPHNPLALENLGLVWIHLGNFAEAVRCLEQAQAQKPHDDVTAQNLTFARQELEARRPLSFDGAAAGNKAAATISLCLIAKDEAENLPRLFESVRDVVDEIVLVDTGSADNTAAIAEAWGARVVHFEWINDFAAAKNVALEHASKDWILHLDADMALEPEHAAKIRLAAASGLAGFYMLNVQSRYSDGWQGIVEKPWLFKNVTGVRFVGAVHEQIGPQLQAAGLSPARTDIVVQHYGYLSEAALRAKRKRDVEILLACLAAGEAAPETPYYLARAYHGLQRYPKAIAEFQKFLAQPGVPWRMRANAYHALADSLLNSGDRTAALATTDEYTRLFPHDRVSWATAGRVYGILHVYEKAVAALTRALAMPVATGAGVTVEMGAEIIENQLGQAYAALGDWPQAARRFRRAIAAGLRTPTARCDLGQAEWQAGNLAAAEKAFRAALALDADFAEARRQLTTLHANFAEKEEARHVSKRKKRKRKPSSHPRRKLAALRKRAPGSARAAWEQGVKAFNEGDMRAAIAAFEQAVELHPGYVAAHNDLGACHLAQQNYVAARDAFEAALAADPKNLLALENMGLLWVMLGNYAAAVQRLEQVLAQKPHDEATQRHLAIARKELRAREPLSFDATPLDQEETAPTISLCLIAKNEAENLPRLFESVREAVDAIVLVDTGSTDETAAIAEEWGAKVVHFEWINDFAAAKNVALEHAAGDWILHLDADMALEPGHAAKIRRAVAAGKAPVYMINVRSPHANGQSETVAHTWLFKNVPEARFKGAVHEQIWLQLQAAGLEAARTDILVHHFGYETEENRRLRYERDLKILQQQLAAGEGNDRESAMIYFYLGRVHLGLRRFAEAAATFRRFLTTPDILWRVRANAYHALAESQMGLNDEQAALSTVEEYTRLFPHDRPSWVAAAQVYGNARQFERAVAACTRALAIQEHIGAEGLVMEVSDGMIENQIGRAYRGLEDWVQAVAHFRQAVEKGWQTPAAYCDLGRAELRKGDRLAAEAAFRRALELNPGFVESHRQLGLLWLQADDAQRAIECLEQAVALAPQASELHNDLGAAYATVGDLPGAAQAFAAELDLNPRNDSTFNNMGLLHMQLGDLREAVACFGQALRLNRNNADARRNLLRIKQQLSASSIQ